MASLPRRKLLAAQEVGVNASEELSPPLLDCADEIPRSASWSAGGCRSVRRYAMPVLEVAGPQEVEKPRRRASSGCLPSMVTVRDTLNALSNFSKGRRAAKRARRLFERDVGLALTTASWITLLALPIAVPSSAHALVALSNGAFLDWWGFALCTVLWTVYQDLGNTMKFALNSMYGTFLALANMFFLNVCFSPIFGGGAHRDMEHMPGGWLPLCYDAKWNPAPYASMPAHCFANVAWDQCTILGMLKVLFILSDFVVFVVIVLSLDFNDNIRVFALSFHSYFMTAFVDPSSIGWSGRPTIGWMSAWSCIIGSMTALLCCLFPRRLYALKYAEMLAIEVVVSTGILLESLPAITSELTRQKAESALTESEAIFSEFEAHIEDSWFEDFGHGPSALRRRQLRAFAQCLRGSVLHVSSAHYVAGTLSEEDGESLEGLECLRAACTAARKLIEDPASQERTAAAKQCLTRLSEELPAARTGLSPEAGAFVFVVRGIVIDAIQASKFFVQVAENRAGNSFRPRRSISQKLLRFIRTLRSHFGAKLDRSATHPRFVVRNTLSIFITFLLGWVGCGSVMPPYTHTACCTVCCVIYTFAGASAPLTFARLNGVVVGRVIGTLLQLAFAVNSWWHSCFFLACLFVAVSFFEFFHYHSHGANGSTVSNISCLASVHMVFCAMPANGVFRPQISEDVRLSLLPRQLIAIVASVLGILILTYVDVFFASRASTQAQQRLTRTFKRARRYTSIVFAGSPDAAEGLRSADVCKQELQEDLKALCEVIPYAAEEPMFWRQPFKTELYKSLEWSLRAIGQHTTVIEWVTRLAGSTVYTADISGLCPNINGNAAHGTNFKPQATGNSFLPTMPPISWLPAAAILAEESFQQILGQIQKEMVLLMRSTETLVASVVKDQLVRDEVDDIRDLLEQGLYTEKVAQHLRVGTRPLSQKVWRSAFVQLTTQSLTAAFYRHEQAPDVAESQPGSANRLLGGLRSTVEQIASQVRNERLDWGADSPMESFILQEAAEAGECRTTPSGNVDSFKDLTRNAAESQFQENSSLEMLFECLRNAASSLPAETAAGDEDACRMELLILLVKALFLEIHKMQLALLEY